MNATLPHERVHAGAPQHDIGLGEHGSGAHADRKFTQVQIERTATVQDGGGMRAAHFQGELPMTDIDQRMGQSPKVRSSSPVIAAANRWACAASGRHPIAKYSSGPSHSVAREPARLHARLLGECNATPRPAMPQRGPGVCVQNESHRRGHRPQPSAAGTDGSVRVATSAIDARSAGDRRKPAR